MATGGYSVGVLAWVTAASVFMHAASGAQEAPLTAKPVPITPMRGEFTLAAVGDLIYLRPMLDTIEARSPDMVRLLQSADVTFGNFEMMAIDLDDFKGAPQAESGGTWLIADPRVVDDIKAMGFDLLSLANNHTTDWGVEGLSETEGRLKSAGLTFAGTGRTLQAARAPRYHDTGKGRVALVATSSTFTPMSRAADPLGQVPGRPGLNPLRIERTALVSKEQFEVLAGLAAQTPGARGAQPDGTIRLLGARYRAVEPYAGKLTFSYKMNERDLDGNLLAVRQGQQNSNFAVFTIHNHEPSNSSEVPADFAIELARRAIDAGADGYVGHGPHILRGIEIYKNKPIFYSLGNFAMMNNSLDAIPREMYEQYGAKPGSLTVPELLQARGEKLFADPRLYESVIAVSRYLDGKVSEIWLYPIDLGVDEQGAGRGVPRMAAPAVARRILERLQRLSAPFGTQISIENGIGIIRVATAH